MTGDDYEALGRLAEKVLNYGIGSLLHEQISGRWIATTLYKPHTFGEASLLALFQSMSAAIDRSAVPAPSSTGEGEK